MCRCYVQSTSTIDEGVEDQGSTPFTDNYDIATNRFKAIVDEHISNMTVTDEEIRETERLTRGQNKNQLWFDKRRSLLTASNFGKAAKTKVEPSKKLKAMLYAIFTTEAVQYGIESEEKAVAIYIKDMLEKGITVKVDEVGLLQSKQKPFLAASLDRIITNVVTNEKWGMEIKSPLSKAGMTVDDACKSKNFCLEKLNDGKIRLKRNHDYYLQVQGQLYSASNLAPKGIVLLSILEKECLCSKKIFPLTAVGGEKNFSPDLSTFLKGPFSLRFLRRGLREESCCISMVDGYPMGNTPVQLVD